MGKTSVVDPSKWVDSYADYLFAYAFKRLKDEEMARDLVQETFLAGLENLDTFQHRSHVLTWLTAIMRNKVIDIYRKKSSMSESNAKNNKSNEAVDYFEENGFWKKEHQPEPFGIETDEELTRKEFSNIFERCLAKLPSLWKSIFVMKHLDEEQTDFICKELRLTTSNYWVIIHRAKLNLRECLSKHWMSL